jgi:hypothetical protein
MITGGRPMKPIHEKRFNTLEKFTGFIEKTCTDQSTYLFRGQPRDLPLLPSIARERHTEDDLLVAERLMLDEFQRLSASLISTTPRTTWDWLALAQHHGLPTRLLDWSPNPLTCLWFAVRRPPEKGDGVIWLLQPEAGDLAKEKHKGTLAIKRYMVFAPVHLSQRITAQVSWFTVHKSNPKRPWFEPLEDSPKFWEKLTKIIIPARRFAHFRFYLDRYGVNSGSVIPGLDGLCAYIASQHFYLSDEGDEGRI